MSGEAIMSTGANEEAAIRFTMNVLKTSSDGQEGEHALANHPKFSAWIDEQCGGDEMAMLAKAQHIVSIAEQRLGVDLPY
jgi:hypothetical protein